MSDERRQSARYPTAWVGQLSEGRSAFKVIDASMGGLFLAVDIFPPLGTLLIIEVVVGGKALMLSGQVVRHVEARPTANLPAGVGVRLTRKPASWDELIGGLAPEGTKEPADPKGG